MNAAGTQIIFPRFCNCLPPFPANFILHYRIHWVSLRGPCQSFACHLPITRIPCIQLASSFSCWNWWSWIWPPYDLLLFGPHHSLRALPLYNCYDWDSPGDDPDIRFIKWPWRGWVVLQNASSMLNYVSDMVVWIDIFFLQFVYLMNNAPVI